MLDGIELYILLCKPRNQRQNRLWANWPLLWHDNSQRCHSVGVFSFWPLRRELLNQRTNRWNFRWKNYGQRWAHIIWIRVQGSSSELSWFEKHHYKGTYLYNFCSNICTGLFPLFCWSIVVLIPKISRCLSKYFLQGK